MVKKTITYTDFDDQVRTETFYFGLSKAEIAEMELLTPGGLAAKLQRIVEAQDRHKIVEYFKEIIMKAYGEKTDDGRRLRKDPELSKAFSETEAYSELFMEMLSDATVAADFIKGILPKQDPNGGGFIPAKPPIPADVIDMRPKPN